MKALLVILFIPLSVLAQPLQFQFQPGAFSVSVNEFQTFQPWAGGMDNTTPKFADLHADGVMDFYGGDSRGYINYFHNDGGVISPNFIYITSFYDSILNYDQGWGKSDIDFTDINADGKLDAFIGGGYVLLYHNLGTSTQPNFFGQADTIRDTNGQYVIGTHVALADIDDDGLVDLFAGHYDGHLKYYHNIGTPQNYAFQLVSSNWFNTYTSEGYADPCFGDLDGDGDLDLLLGTGQGHVRYYRNDGTTTNPQLTLVSTNYLNINVQKDASPELADIDGDGDLDLFIGRSPSTGQNVTQGDVYFYRNDGTPQFPNFTYVTSDYLTWDCGGFARPVLVDINGDGLPDLLSCMGSHLLYYRNVGSLGNPQFVYESSNYGNINVIDLQPWLVDINGDGKLDLFTGTSAIPGPPGLKLYLNQGTPQNPNWVLFSNDLIPGVFNTFSVMLVPWTADIDCDGDQDLFVTDNNGYLYFFRNTGTPAHFRFQYETNNWQGLNGGYPTQRYGCFYDMDGDGDLDLFMDYVQQVLPTIHYIRYYRNIGTPQNASMILDSVLFTEYYYAHSPFVADIDLDGDGDLFLGDASGGCRFFRNVAPHPPSPWVHPQPERSIDGLTMQPGGPAVGIQFVLPSAQNVNLSVYDLLGRRIETLSSGLQAAGTYHFDWDARGKASGIYIVNLQTAEGTYSKKLMVVK
jgi:hypothetical protein